MKILTRLVVTALLAFTLGANATVITAVDTGWYDDTGMHNPGNDNYIAGLCSDCGGPTYRNFFAFDLTGIGSIASATLLVDAAAIASDGTYSLWDVATDISTLLAGGSGLTGIYDDLGTGQSFGSIDLFTTDSNQILSITLSAAAISSINASSGLWALGGSYASDLYHAFGGSQGSLVQLDLMEGSVPVPAPSTLLLVITGLLGLRMAKRLS